MPPRSNESTKTLQQQPLRPACQQGPQWHEPRQDLVDPQHTMLYPDQPREMLPDPFSMDLTLIWDTPMDRSLSQFESVLPSQVDVAAATSSLNASGSSSVADLNSHRRGEASGASSKSSLPSLSSTSQPFNKRMYKVYREKREQKEQAQEQEQEQEQVQAQAQARALPSMAPVPCKKASTSNGGMEGAKRANQLERNRIAASKCRQMKKEWVHELEESKAGMEAKCVELRRQYCDLLDEVGMIKNLLMCHSSCGDPNVDQWIGLEAYKFVQKSSHESKEAEAVHPPSPPLLLSA